MKKLVLFLTIALFTTSGVFAQQRQRATPEERAKRQTETLVKELNLTDAQKTKVYEINLKYAEPAGKGKEMSREELRAQFQKNQEERTAAIKAVLTAEQQVKFDEHQKKMQENRKRRN